MKRFATPGKWSTIIDATTDKTYKVMKKGKFMQIPIQSLNTVHQQEFEFDIDLDIFKYHLSKQELDDIELVTVSGSTFAFEESLNNHQRKRNKKEDEKR